MFVDTPGPNNASCEEHAKITEQVISEADFSSLVFVINASVAGVEDEWRLLSRLQKQLSERAKTTRIIFAVNKIDLLDSEQGEAVAEVVLSCQRHLMDMGFKSPIVIPISSELGLRIRQMLSDAVKFRRANGERRVKLPNGQRRGLYMSVDTPRMQSKIRGQVELFLTLRKFYRSGLLASSMTARVLRRLEHQRVGKMARRICIDGKFFGSCAESEKRVA